MRGRFILLTAIPVAFAAGFATCLFWPERVEPLTTNTTTTLGYIGCSNTSQAVMGYLLQGGQKMWDIPEGHMRDYDGGAVDDWINDLKRGTRFWRAFDAYLAANPNTNTIWWQLCVRHTDTPTVEDALQIAQAVKARIPNVAIYVSSLPAYTDGVCEITGVEGIERGRALAGNIAAASDAVKPGPILAAHHPNELEADGCHLNPIGILKAGVQLKEFFDSK